MIKKSNISFTSFIIFCLCFFTFNVDASEKVYTLGYSPGSLYHAIIRDRMKVVYERAGLKAKFVPFPHKRSISNANEGLIDGDVGRNPNVEKKFKNLRRVNVLVNESLGSGWTTNDNIKTYDLKDLKNYRVGYVSGVRWVQKKLAGIEATTVRKYPQLMKMLLDGRIDIAVGTDISIQAAIDDMNTDTSKLRQLTPLANRSPTYHYVNKKNADIIPKLEKALKELKAEDYWK